MAENVDWSAWVEFSVNTATEMVDASRQLPVQTWPLWALCVFPIVLTASTLASLAFTISPAVMELGDLCLSSHSPFPSIAAIPIIGPVCCTLSVFFQATVATTWAKIFMFAFLSFIAALITITLVESNRINELPNRIVRYPSASWVLVNLISGAVVTPLLMAPASFYHSRKTLQQKSGSNAHKRACSELMEGTMDVNRPVDTKAKLAIPIALLLGLITPSAVLILVPSPVISILWQFCPFLVAGTFWITNRVLHRAHSFLMPLDISDRTNGASATVQFRTQLALFALPELLSIAAHLASVAYSIHILASMSPSHDRPLGDTSAAGFTQATIQLLSVNFGAIYLAVLYWLYVEGGLQTLLSTIEWTMLAGPGAGLCKGWIKREFAMQQYIKAIIVSSPFLSPSISATTSRNLGTIGLLSAEEREADETTPLLGSHKSAHRRTPVVRND